MMAVGIQMGTDHSRRVEGTGGGVRGGWDFLEAGPGRGL